MVNVKSRREFLCDSTLIAGTLIAAGSVSAGVKSAPKGNLRVGACVTDVSPQTYPVAVNGGFSPRFCKENSDPTCVRAIMVASGDQEFIFATIDVCLFETSYSDRIKEIVSKKLGIPKEHISLSATHTHSGPGLFGKFYTEYNAKYMEWLVGKAAEGIIKTKERLQPAQFGWTTAREPRHVFCRRFLMKPGTAWDEPGELVDAPRNLAQMNPGKNNPNSVTRTGFPDQTIYILSFQTLDGQPLAMLANYSTHYAGKTKGVSADYFGVFARNIKKKIGAGDNFVAMMTNGTSGDTNCNDFLDKDQPPYDYEIVGEHVAEKVFEVYGKIKYSQTVPISSKEVVMRLANRKPTPEQVKFAKEFLAKNENDKKVKVTTKVYAQRTIEDASSPEFADVPLQAIRIGDIGICTIPNEVFSFTGHDLRAYSPFENTFVISLANGYNGYLPTAEQFELGGYTTWRGTSYLENLAEPKIRAELLVMLNELAKTAK